MAESQSGEFASELVLALLGHQGARPELRDAFNLCRVAACLDGSVLLAMSRTCTAGRQRAMQASKSVRLQLSLPSPLHQQWTALHRALHLRGSLPLHLDVHMEGERDVLSILHFLAHQATLRAVTHPDQPHTVHLTLQTLLTDAMVDLLCDSHLRLACLTVHSAVLSTHHSGKQWAVQQLVVENAFGLHELLARVPQTKSIILGLTQDDPGRLTANSTLGLDATFLQRAQVCQFKSDTLELDVGNDLLTSDDNNEPSEEDLTTTLEAALGQLLSLDTLRPLHVRLSSYWPRTPATGGILTAAAAAHPDVTFGLGFPSGEVPDNDWEEASWDLDSATMTWLLDHAPCVTEVYLGELNGGLEDYSARTCSWRHLHVESLCVADLGLLPSPMHPDRPIKVTCDQVSFTLSDFQIELDTVEYLVDRCSDFELSLDSCTLDIEVIPMSASVPDTCQPAVLAGCLELLGLWEPGIQTEVLVKGWAMTPEVSAELAHLPSWVETLYTSGWTAGSKERQAQGAVSLGYHLRSNTRVRQVDLRGARKQVVKNVCEGVVRACTEEREPGAEPRMRVCVRGAHVPDINEWLNEQGWEQWVVAEEAAPYVF